MEILIYSGVLILIGLISFGGVWLKRKFQLKEQETELLYLILQVANFITQKIEFKYQDGVATIVGYCLEAWTFVEDFENITDTETKIQIIKDKAIEICEEHNIFLDTGVIEIVDMVIDYLCEQKIIK